MAKISDLVKTYRMLSDPDAPDWNVKFVGAIVAGILLVAATAGGLWWATHGGPLGEPTAPAAQTRTGPDAACCDEAAACDPPQEPVPTPIVCPTTAPGAVLP